MAAVLSKRKMTEEDIKLQFITGPVKIYAQNCLQAPAE